MKSLSRAKQVFLYAASFLPFAVFKVGIQAGPGPGGLPVAALVTTIFCALIIAVAYRWDTPSYLDWAIGGYFVMVLLAAMVWPAGTEAFLSDYSVAAVYACLFAAAFFPPLLGREPFTCHYARRSTPETVWKNPVFIRINRVMTLVWAGVFAVCILTSLYPSWWTRAGIPIVLVVGLGVPFNLRFPDYYLKRLGLPSLSEQRRMAEAQAPLREPAVSSGPLPESARQAISRMPEAFCPDEAGDLDAVLGFVVSGDETFEAYFHIHDGTCEAETAPVRKPDLVIHTPAGVWLAIARGERKGDEAFMAQAYKAEGNLGLLLQMGRLFGGQARA